MGLGFGVWGEVRVRVLVVHGGTSGLLEEAPRGVGGAWRGVDDVRCGATMSNTRKGLRPPLWREGDARPIHPDQPRVRV